jgi:hypothetical protein
MEISTSAGRKQYSKTIATNDLSLTHPSRKSHQNNTLYLDCAYEGEQENNNRLLRYIQQGQLAITTSDCYSIILLLLLFMQGASSLGLQRTL